MPSRNIYIRVARQKTRVNKSGATKIKQIVMAKVHQMEKSLWCLRKVRNGNMMRVVPSTLYGCWWVSGECERRIHATEKEVFEARQGRLRNSQEGEEKETKTNSHKAETYTHTSPTDDQKSDDQYLWTWRNNAVSSMSKREQCVPGP